MAVRRKRVMKRRRRNMRRKTRRAASRGNVRPDDVYHEKINYEFELTPGGGGGLTSGFMQVHWTNTTP